MKITVAGTGYVGLVTAVCMAEKGHEVNCIDINKEKIEMLKSGHSPIYENGLEELMQKNKEKLHFTLDSQEAYQDAEIIFIGVGTPEKRDGSANLKYINEVVDQISEIVQQECVVVVKSTVPIGTNDKIEKKLKSKNTKIDVVSNPEFLAQGTAVHDTLCASRIVIGAENKRAKEIMLKVYEKFDAPFVLTNRRSAEMIKYASNDFLALKISYINEIANLCEEIGANVQDVALGMGYDPRIGSKFLKAGIGYGGSCFPKDTKALHWLSNLHDHELKTVKAAIEVNEQQKLRLIKKARKKYNNFEGLTIAVLGLTFKPDTDDLREAPSLTNIPIFLEEGAKVKAWDPVGIPNFKKIYPLEIEYCNSIEETIKDADMCFIFTEWSEIVEFDLDKYSELMKRAVIYDGRNIYDNETLKNKGIHYFCIGK
ncbi:UDPglucose 6-dehydrogenase [Eubacterium maltosivorans]|uniref:UDP-glucose dehydrogenase family protein n=1 Tax=Eubacterium maltosivorans TaxID=2041044 RepID=UPI0008895719|nr:UDP-glucose/GDP-mannose dehydrogenase family protein [Eubacterium maltosivorans]WPK80835.1 UDP-glucose 6-dehydrogenase YwqF [Eubacterium maltosivorans]SDP84681.1 UDPglucose 6-dehydrogenase [Eubacterium maltosivorans]